MAAQVKRAIPASFVAQRHAPQRPTRGTTSPEELNKNTAAVKPLRGGRRLTGRR